MFGVLLLSVLVACTFEASSHLWRWPALDNAIGRAHKLFGYVEVAIELWPFGTTSAKPLTFKGTWPGLKIVRLEHWSLFGKSSVRN